MEGPPLINSAEEFVALRTSEDPAEQSRASRDEASLEVWLAVVARYPALRRWVAHNKTVPSAILRLLAQDPDPAVRWVVATKNKADPALLRMLAGDADEGVRVRVAVHKRVPDDVLRSLAVDGSWVVRDAAKRTLASREPPTGKA